MTMDHELCSENLAPYVRGELAAPATAEIEEHLAECEDCRIEERGLRALIAPADEPLTEVERAQLHRNLRANVDLPETTAGPRLSWLPPALAVAAMLLVVVVGIQFLGGAGGDEESAGSSDGAGAGGGHDGPGPVTLSLSGGTLSELGAPRSEDAPEAAAAPKPTRDEDPLPQEGAISSDAGAEEKETSFTTLNKGIKRYGRSSQTFLRFSQAYTAEDAEALADDFIEELVNDAPLAAAGQVAECAELVVDAREGPVLPVVAGHGSFRGDPSLLLGFVWTPDEDGPLDNFVFYVWPRGDCEAPTHSQIGRVDGGKD